MLVKRRLLPHGMSEESQRKANGVELAEHMTLNESFIENFQQRYSPHILKILLTDRTTGKNIIWADNEYESLGEGYQSDDEITIEKTHIIKPRVTKESKRQNQRTKSHAEVFTPSWLCNQMNNDVDEAWFGNRNIFNTENTDDDGAKSWKSNPNPIVFPKTKGHRWHAYIETTRLEITCGEAPFICSRYDTVTGRTLPVSERIGFLDRKLRIVSEKTKTRKEWVKWALAALKSSYGFEYQGDNLLIARINVLETFAEHMFECWGERATLEEVEQAAWIISWNLWQMDGLTCAVPTSEADAVVQSVFPECGNLRPDSSQPSFDLFTDIFDEQNPLGDENSGASTIVPLCVLYDWRNGESFEFASLKDGEGIMLSEQSRAEQSRAEQSRAEQSRA